MKKINIIILLIAGSMSARGQATNTFPTSGNVGINTGHLVQTGSYNLQTQGAVKLKDYLLFDSDGDWTGGNYFTIQDDTGGNFLRMGYGFNNHFVLASSGNVGIGTTNPASILEVSDTPELNGSKPVALRISGLRTSSSWDPDASIAALDFYSSDGSGSGAGVRTSITMVTENAIGSKFGLKFMVDDGASLKEGLRITNSGNVGIGTSDPLSKLSVNGQIRATEVKVLAAINVPDYVFESDYQLRTLEETKAYISANKHLPEIPSAKEMGENGIDLGDMNMRLLKKIEELTLHQIALMEELQSVKKDLQELKDRTK